MRLFKKLFIHSSVHYIIASGAALAFLTIYLAMRKFTLIFFPDALQTTGLLFVLIGLLMLGIFYGALDTFTYAFSTFRNRKKRKYEDLVEYVKIKENARKKQDLYFMPYIATGAIILIVGIIAGFFIKPLPKLDQPANLVCEQVQEGQIKVTWDNDEDAVNGYIVYYALYIENPNEEDKQEWYQVTIPQTESGSVSYTIENIDTTKSYIIYVGCLSVEGSFNGSDYSDIIFNPNE